jgi:hypothetical protein
MNYIQSLVLTLELIQFLAVDNILKGPRSPAEKLAFFGVW